MQEWTAAFGASGPIGAHSASAGGKRVRMRHAASTSVLEARARARAPSLGRTGSGHRGAGGAWTGCAQLPRCRALTRRPRGSRAVEFVVLPTRSHAAAVPSVAPLPRIVVVVVVVAGRARTRRRHPSRRPSPKIVVVVVAGRARTRRRHPCRRPSPKIIVVVAGRASARRRHPCRRLPSQDRRRRRPCGNSSSSLPPPCLGTAGVAALGRFLAEAVVVGPTRASRARISASTCGIQALGGICSGGPEPKSLPAQFSSNSERRRPHSGRAPCMCRPPGPVPDL